MHGTAWCLCTAGVGRGWFSRLFPTRAGTPLPRPRGEEPRAAPAASPPGSSPPSVLEAVESVVQSRRSCKRFAPDVQVDRALVARLLQDTTRAPTGFNLQPWSAVVVDRRQHAPQHAKLCAAALGQAQVATAPYTIVFAGDKEPERCAPPALEVGLESGYYSPLYGPAYLRSVYYLLHGGPCESMSVVKRAVSSVYSQSTGSPLLTVPETKQAYAWKQTMIPATTFVHLATAAGLDTAMLEGFDESAVRAAVGLPDRFTVPVVVCIGYAPVAEDPSGVGAAFHPVRSPRFSTSHLIRWGAY